MKISLDFDDTFTRDPKLWEDFVGSAQRRGHEFALLRSAQTASKYHIQP
jgi:hypothetical protein